MSKQETCGCDANHDDIISVNIVIPHFTPINTVDMSVIDVKYEIQVRLSTVLFLYSANC